MPITDQDARMLTYLARRIRQETHGAATWDEAGTYPQMAKFIGQSFTETLDRVVRHAADKDARTPGAIHRPFLPDAPPKPQPRNTGPWCVVCGVNEGMHRSPDHDFTERGIRNGMRR